MVNAGSSIDGDIAGSRCAGSYMYSDITGAGCAVDASDLLC